MGNKMKTIKLTTFNDLGGITDGDTYKEIKYKKAKPLLDSGEWVVYVGGPIT